jgi:hypothetical protein
MHAAARELAVPLTAWEGDEDDGLKRVECRRMDACGSVLLNLATVDSYGWVVCRWDGRRRRLFIWNHR